MAKFDIKTQATKPLYAGVGATDRAVKSIRGYVAETQKRLDDVQKNVKNIDLEPKALRDQAVTRIADLQAEATGTVTGVYGNLVSRGERLVTRVRRQQSTKATTASARTTTAKAKTTKTQATKATKSTAKKTSTTARKTAAKKSTAPKSSAKATATAAKKTAANAGQAATDAAQKVGD
jgi:hypothetical protein